MSSIISAELFRLGKTKWFWRTLVAFVIIELLSAVVSVLQIILFVEDYTAAGIAADVQSSMLSFVSLSSVANLFAICCTAAFLSKEITEKTINFALAANKSRAQIFAAYAVVALIIGGIFWAVSLVSLVAFTLIASGIGSLNAASIVSSLVCCTFLSIIAMLFAQACTITFTFALKKQSATIVLSLVTVMFLPGVISTVGSIVMAICYSEITSEVYETWISWMPLVNLQMLDPLNLQGGLIAKIASFELLFLAGLGGLGYLAAVKSQFK